MQALLVVDQPEVGDLLAAAVQDVGFDATVVCESAAACEAFAAHRHALVLTAWRMSDLDGLAVCRKVRELDRQHGSIVLVVTNSSATSELQAILNAGADDYILYPLEPPLLRLRLSISALHAQAKQSEAKLEHSEARWRSLVENAPDIIILADLDGTIRFINRDTPIARASIGRKTYEYIDEPFKEPMRQAFEAVRATGKPQRYEVHGQTEHGIGMLWYANRVGPIWHNGRVESCVLIGTDITDRKIAEEQVQRERVLLRRLLDLQERERQIVAYDIHDGLVQHLTGGLMHLEAASAWGEGVSASSQSEYERGLALLRDALTEARRLISGLRPPILDEQGIVASLEYLVNESRPDIPQLAFVNRTHVGRLAAPLEVAIFRITQEALANIRQHSGAKRARVELLQHGDWVRLVIRDWGCGFDTNKVHEERFGLQGIRQRARLLGTIAIIESAPGMGTLIAVDFPLVRGDTADVE